MTAWLTAYVSRLLVGSLFCWALLAIAGKSAAAQVLRMACACLILLLTLSPIRQGKGLVDDLLWQLESTTRQLEDRIADSQAGLADDLHTGVEAQINRQLQQAGYTSRVHLSGGIDGEGVYRVTQAVVDGPEEAGLREYLSLLTGLQADAVIFESAGKGGEPRHAEITGCSKDGGIFERAL